MCRFRGPLEKVSSGWTLSDPAGVCPVSTHHGVEAAGSSRVGEDAIRLRRGQVEGCGDGALEYGARVECGLEVASLEERGVVESRPIGQHGRARDPGSQDEAGTGRAVVGATRAVGPGRATEL